MTFTQAVRSGIANVFNWRGRAATDEFWFFVIFAIIVSVPFWIAFAVAYMAWLASILTAPEAIYDGLPLSVTLTQWAAWALYLVLAAVIGSVAVRRLHDRDKSGLWLLFFYGPFAVYCALSAIIMIDAADMVAGVAEISQTIEASDDPLQWDNVDAPGQDLPLVVTVGAAVSSLLMLGAGLWMVVWLSLPGTPGANRFGPPPTHRVASGQEHGENT